MKWASYIFALVIFLLLPFRVEAGTVLFECEIGACNSAIIDPKSGQAQGNHSLRVTGTYTNSDHSNIVGIAVIEGKILNQNRQKWDGVFLISQGQGRIMHRQAVAVDGAVFNLDTDREAFLSLAKAKNLSIIQSHLLINAGKVDVRNQARQPRFIRRMLYQMPNGDLGIYQTENAVTLYDAAMEIAKDIAPLMALNLDMGSFDYCVLRTGIEKTICGVANVSESAFSNFIELSR